VSASTDNNVCIWDILSGECEQKYRFPSPILKVNLKKNYELYVLSINLCNSACLTV
jgi:COMPASS component SWD1